MIIRSPGKKVRNLNIAQTDHNTQNTAGTMKIWATREGLPELSLQQVYVEGTHLY